MKNLGRVASLGILLSVLSLRVGAQNAQDSRVHFMLEAQPLRAALNEWAEQAGLSVVLPAGQAAAERITSRVEGEYSPRRALDLLLEGSGLTYAYVDDKTVAIREQEMTIDRPAAANGVEADERIRVAQAEGATAAGEATADSPGRESAAEGSENAVGEQLEEITVTAQRRAERLTDVPISISVLSGAELTKSTAEGIGEMLNRVPGVFVTSEQGANIISVRGVSASAGYYNGASPTAYYLDTIPFGLNETAVSPDSSAFDLDRVEVLRGPQGTLYGASALNGVVRVLTKNANLDEFESAARASVSSTDGGGVNSRADAMLNLPLVPGIFAARAVLGYQDLSGWLDKPIENDANDGQLKNYRLRLNAQPTDDLTLGFSGWMSRSEYGAPNNSHDGENSNSTIDEPISTGYDALGLSIGYRFARFSVASATSYLDYDNEFDLDYAPFMGFSTPLVVGIDSRVFSQEVTLSSAGEGEWRWSAGAIYRDAEDTSSSAIPAIPFLNVYTRTSESIAVFGEVTRMLAGGFAEVSAGLRYFEDDARLLEPLVPDTTAETFDKVNPRVVLALHPGRDLIVYASYAEGFRSGASISSPILQTDPSFPSLKPDTLSNYEIGAKGSALDGRLRFDSALYYIDWQDVQQNLTVFVEDENTGTEIPFVANVNGSSASGWGLDLGASFQPLRGLDLGLGFSWNDLAMDDAVFSSGALLFSSGDRLNLSPEFTAAASASYAFPLGSGGLDGQLSASANYTSEQDLRTIFPLTQAIGTSDDLLISRVSFAIRAADRWTASLFVDNLNDERGTSAGDPYSPDFERYIRPRTAGVQIELSF